jgi:hypothetical protein
MTPVQREALTYWLITYGMGDVRVHSYLDALPYEFRGISINLMNDHYIIMDDNDERIRRITQKAIDELNQGETP